MREPLTKTNLGIKDRCDQLFHLTKNLGYRATSVADALRFGSLYHIGREIWWSTMRVIQAQEQSRAEGHSNLVTDPMNAIRMAIQGMRSSTVGKEVDEFDLVKAEELMRGYHACYVDQPYKILFVEKQMTAKHLNPETGGQSQTWDLMGVLDSGAIDEQGRFVIFEGKTSSLDITPGSTYWQNLQMDPQPSIYWILASENPDLPEVQGVIYDVVKKPAIRPYKETPDDKKKFKCDKRCKGKCVGHTDGVLYAGQHETSETPEEYRMRLKQDIRDHIDEYYVRGEITRTAKELEEFREVAWQKGLQIQNNRSKGTHPKSPGACEQYRHMCEFFPVCTGQASLDDPLLYTKIDNVNPELKVESE